ncbi:MAG: hypothetical protein KAR19_19875 [Bacteroidales bacterium]|nr:hypothetical protein [Bacteroidales bacterium]
MKQMLKVGWLCMVLTFGIAHAHSQGLFESSLSGNHEMKVSNSFSLGGFIRSVAYVANIPENDCKYLQAGYGQVGLLLNAKAGEWASAKADIRFRYGTEFEYPLSELEIREVYVDLSSGPAGLKIGKLIDPWGKATLFNPTEKITPLDPTVRSPEEDDMYLGVWAMQGRINLGPFMKLTGTWKPLYQSSVLLIGPVPMPEYVNFLEPVFPGVELKEGSYGINYDIYLPVLDGSLYWFDGYHHWPGIRFDSFILDSVTMEPLTLNIREQAYRIRMLGLDLSLPLGSWIFRAEGAWQQSKESYNELEYVPFPELSYTAEIERSGSNTTMLAGYYGKYILDYSAPVAEPSLNANQEQFFQLMQQGMELTGGALDGMIREQVGAFNRLYNYQLEKKYHTAYIICKWNLFHNQLELTLPVVYNMTTEEWILQPGVSFSPTDGIKISGGFSGLYGSKNSLYDLVGPVLNAGYLSLKLTF